MRAKSACVFLVMALALAFGAGSAAARQTHSGTSVLLEKIVIDPAHPNMITVTFNGLKSHRAVAVIGGPAVKPVNVTPALKGFPFYISNLDKYAPATGWTTVNFTPHTDKFVIHVTFPPPMGSVGHGACYVARLISIDNKAAPGQPMSIHCVNDPRNLNF